MSRKKENRNDKVYQKKKKINKIKIKIIIFVKEVM